MTAALFSLASIALCGIGVGVEYAAHESRDWAARPDDFV